jgi:hypothetical protein
MNGKNQLIMMHKISDARDVEVCSASGFYQSVNTDIVATKNSLTPIAPGLQQRYGSFPTGIVTPAGSIIPQPLVPTDDFVGYDNGVYINNAISQKPFTSYGYVWSAVKMTAATGAASGIQQAVKFVDLYGIHQD